MKRKWRSEKREQRKSVTLKKRVHYGKGGSNEIKRGGREKVLKGEQHNERKNSTGMERKRRSNNMANLIFPNLTMMKMGSGVLG